MAHCRAAGLASQQRWGEPHRARGSYGRHPPTGQRPQLRRWACLRLTGIDAMGLIWAPTLGVVWQRHRELETQLSGPANPGVDLGPISMTINISMNNGNSDAMDNSLTCSAAPLASLNPVGGADRDATALVAHHRPRAQACTQKGKPAHASMSWPLMGQNGACTRNASLPASTSKMTSMSTGGGRPCSSSHFLRR